MKTELDSQEQFLNAFKKLLDDLFQECITKSILLLRFEMHLRELVFKNLMLKENIGHTLEVIRNSFCTIEKEVKNIHNEFELFNEKDKK
jgi:hypothetical protein